MTIEEYKAMHTKTPLVYSALLSAHSGHNVFLKLETKQVTGSFKPRGIGRSCWDAVRRLGPDAHLVVASGGNAGLAAAMASQKLGVKCTIFVHAKTEESIKNRMVDYGAEVTVSDAGWETVNRLALECAAADPKAKYIHPFEGDALIRGHVSIVDEIYDQLPEVMRDAGLTDPTDRPDIISSAVGGGGLIRGIMTGVGERSLQDGRPPVHILGVSAIGGDPWGLSLETDHPVRIESPWSLASSLTCKMCSELAIRDARIYAYNGNLSPDNIETSADVNDTAGPYLSSVRAADAQCGAAAWQVAEELGEGIELSTGAAVVPIYQPKVLDEIIRKKKLPEKLNVVVIVCGGSRLKGIEKFKADYGKGFGDVYVNGEKIM